MVRGQGRARPVALIVTPGYLPLLGGMERECALLAEEFKRRGFEPVVITEQKGGSAPRRERLAGVEVRRIRAGGRRSLLLQLRVAAQISLHVLLLRRRVAFAVVRTMTLPALAVGLLKILRLVPFPTLVTAETGYDVAALRERPLYPASRALAAAHDCLNGLSRANVDDLRAGGFPEAKITSIPNGVDTSAWHSTRSPERVRRLLFLGRLDPEKGIFELADAFADVRLRQPELHLTFAGEGPARAELERRCGRLVLGDSVRFAGRVPYERLGILFAQVDCLVLPSYSEGMPLSILEAAAHRRVLVVSDIGDLRRLFGDRIHFCRPRDVGSLIAAIEAAVTAPEPDADYADVIEAISIESVAGEMLDRLGVPPPFAR